MVNLLTLYLGCVCFPRKFKQNGIRKKFERKGAEEKKKNEEKQKVVWIIVINFIDLTQ